MTWQEQLIRRNPALFVRSFRGVAFAPGYPRCAPGWQHVVTRLVERVAAAANDGSVYFTHMVCENGVLRTHWSSRSEIPQRSALKIEEAIGLAEARSASACIDCGAEGRLFATDFVLAPLCKVHQRGTLVPIVAGGDVFLRRGVLRERPVLVQSRYDWDSDAFLDLPTSVDPKAKAPNGRSCMSRRESAKKGQKMGIRRSERLSQVGQFVSVKCGGLVVPLRHPLVRDALVQAALDPAVRSIEYLPTIPTTPTTWGVDAIAIESDDGRYYLDIVEARPRRSIAQKLIVAQALLDLGLRPLVRTETEVLREPRCSNARTVFEYAGRPIDLGLRMQILGALTHDGAMPLGELLSRLQSYRDPVTAVMSLACHDLIELDLVSTPLGPHTMMRLRK
ncbi:hypothetical protein ACVI1J_009152 [Bradyrhizobium diazoefficiens]